MGKNIVLCLDGTNNQFSGNQTNVVRLYRCAINAPENQLTYYDPGVGTMATSGWVTNLGKKFSVLLDLATAMGFNDRLRDAYRYLMVNYQPGDKIFLFGFSRGAFTARALAGMISAVGLLKLGTENLIPYAIRYWRNCYTPKGARVAADFKRTMARSCEIHFVGVWDTVGSIGWFNYFQTFPRTHRNRHISIVRHAVAIDEKRSGFRHNLMEPHKDKPDQDILNVWFAGVHSDVGGGYCESESGLAKLAFEWMFDEAVAAGLIIDPQMRDVQLGKSPDSKGRLKVQPDCFGTQHESLNTLWWLVELLPRKEWSPVDDENHWTWAPGCSRRIPQNSLVHASVFERRAGSAYRPENLPEKIEKFGSCTPANQLQRCSTILGGNYWNPTGIVLEQGQTYEFKVIRREDWRDGKTPRDEDGYVSPNWFFKVHERFRRSANNTWYCLMAAFGTNGDTAFRIDQMTPFIAPRTGELHCFANDLPWMYWNNHGELELQVKSDKHLPTCLAEPPAHPLKEMMIRFLPPAMALLFVTLLAFVSLAGATRAWLLKIATVPGKVPTAVLTNGADYAGVRQNLERTIWFLSESNGVRHAYHPHVAKLDSVRAFIKENLTRSGYSNVGEQLIAVDTNKYSQRGQYQHAYNVVAEKPGITNRNIIVLGAHYDTMPFSPKDWSGTEGDFLPSLSAGTPGANDNASGVAALLELARLLEPKKLRYPVRFVAFANEEPPFFQKKGAMGSWQYANECRKRGDDIAVMISLESMAVYTRDTDNRKRPWHKNIGASFLGLSARPDYVAFMSSWKNSSGNVAKHWARAFSENASTEVRTCSLPFIDGEFFAWSDDWSFSQNGYAAFAVTDTAFYRSERYHESWDNAANLSPSDYETFTQVVLSLASAIEYMTNLER